MLTYEKAKVEAAVLLVERWILARRHSLALTALMGLLVTAQAYVWPFTTLVLH